MIFLLAGPREVFGLFLVVVTDYLGTWAGCYDEVTCLFLVLRLMLYHLVLLSVGSLQRILSVGYMLTMLNL